MINYDLTNEHLLLSVMVCTGTASGTSTVAGTGKVSTDQVLVPVLLLALVRSALMVLVLLMVPVMVCVCMYLHTYGTITNNVVNADTGTVRVMATDTVLVLVLDPRYQCTVVPISVPVFEQYSTFVLHYFLLIPYIQIT